MMMIFFFVGLVGDEDEEFDDEGEKIDDEDLIFILFLV